MNELLQSTRNNKSLKLLFFLLILFLPTQLGKHFWPDFSYVFGQRVDYLSPTIYFTDILAMLFVGFWFYSIYKNKQKNKILKNKYLLFKPKKIFIVFSLFLLFIGLGIFFSTNPLEGWYKFIKLLEYIILGFAIKDFLSKEKDLFLLSYSLVFGVIFESFLAFWQFVMQSSIGGFFYYFGERTFNGSTPGIANASINGQLVLRPYATFSHPNVLAGYLVISMAILIQAGILKKRFLNMLFFIGLILGNIVLFLTLSRIAIVIWIMLGCFWFIMFFKRKLKEKVKNEYFYLFILLFILTAGGIFFLTPLHYRFLLSQTDESFLDRIFLMQVALNMIFKHPVFGVGFGNFFTELPLFFSKQHHYSVILLQPVHNILLFIGAEIGIPGLIFVLWFLFKTFKQIDKKYLTLILSVLLIGQTDHYFLTLQQGQLLLTLVLAICWNKMSEQNATIAL